MNESTQEFYARMYIDSGIVPNGEEVARWAAIMPYLLRAFETHKSQHIGPMRILDLGCGRGWLTNLASLFGTCEGVEPVGVLVQQACQQFPLLNFTQGTAITLLERSSFQPYDVVICSEVIEHIVSTCQLSFLQDITRLLASDGRLILTTPRAEFYKRWQKHYGGQPVEAWLTEKQIQSLLIQCGFQILAHDRIYVPFARLAPRLIRFCESPRVHRWLDSVRLNWVIAALRYIVSIYQIWYCERKA